VIVERELLAYWPRESDVSACVKTDAEASDKAVLLAVHQSMQFERRVIGGESESVDLCDEHALLQAFLAPNPSDGRVIVPIVGSSGIGKSHVIRWLDAQIRRMPGSDRRVIIRIPKGMSLKGVLGILLNDLSAPAYDRFRKDLVRAQEALEPSEAAGLLCEMLAHTVTEMGIEARAQLVKNPNNRAAQERDAFCRADMLPALLRNQLLRDQHFVRARDGHDGVVKRLVEQLTEDRDASGADDRQHSFTSDDLAFGLGIDRESLGRAEIKAISQFDREDRRTAAARILNEALDDAKQRLLRLDPTVAELFDAVRQELLKDQRELVLLVEDFAVLSGLQKQLLQVIIKEAYRDGRQVLCTMRTALAYTTGYMVTATVLTRATTEYVIADQPGSEDEMLGRIERLVGAYLNAARSGQAVLERAYERKSANSTDPDDWIPVFSSRVEPEARATLDTFGKSIDGYELFPFNREAVRELSREGCLLAGRLVYNPRFVIQNVINKVLNHRTLFEEANFPTAQFGSNGRPLPARVTQELKRRVSTASFERYLRFFAYWGGFPGTIKEAAHVDARLLAAFGLDQLELDRDATESSGVGTTTPTLTKATLTPTEVSKRAQHADPLEAKWEAILEAWRAGHILPQAEANQLRKWVAEALNGFVEWNWDLFRPRKDAGLDTWFGWVYIPQAAGNEGRTGDGSMVEVCSDADLSDQAKSARIQSELLALIRFHGVHRNSWDYTDAEDDLPTYGAFVEKIANRARPFVRRRYFKADWDPIPSLVNGLLIGARALGIEAATKDRDPASLAQALFSSVADDVAPSPSTTTDVDVTTWSDFTAALGRCRRLGERGPREQPSWQGHLLNLVGARQGDADTVHAIDVMQLKPAIERTLATWNFSEVLPNPSGLLDFASLRTTYNELKRLDPAVGKAQRRLYRWRAQTIAWLGEEIDKDTIVRQAKDTIEAAKAGGHTNGIDTKRVLQLLEEFRGAKLMAALDDAGKLGDDASRGLVLTVLGRDYDSVVRVCDELQPKLDETLRSIEANLASESLKYGADPFAEAVSSLSNELEEMRRLLEKVEHV
jgi:hypothetical protein